MTPKIQVLFKKLPHFKGLALPVRMTGSSAGFDLAAALDKPVTLNPGEHALLPTGIAVAIPAGYEGQVRPRSGLALRHGLGILNSPGTIDADYRGEIKVILMNHGKDPYEIKRGDRIAQLIIAESPRVELREAATLPETPRGEGGFGHTGK